MDRGNPLKLLSVDLFISFSNKSAGPLLSEEETMEEESFSIHPPARGLP